MDLQQPWSGLNPDYPLGGISIFLPLWFKPTLAIWSEGLAKSPCQINTPSAERLEPAFYRLQIQLLTNWASLTSSMLELYSMYRQVHVCPTCGSQVRVVLLAQKKPSSWLNNIRYHHLQTQTTDEVTLMPNFSARNKKYFRLCCTCLLIFSWLNRLISCHDKLNKHSWKESFPG